MTFWKREGIDCVSVYELSEHDNQTEESLDFQKAAQHMDSARHPCGQLWKQCFVYPDGEVSTCCRTMILVPQQGIISLGELSASSLRDIWVGQSYSATRRSLILQQWQNIPFCKGCQIWANYDTKEERVDEDTTRFYNPVESFYEFGRVWPGMRT